jgi:NDP-sugar pyrophosphorylase family protein
MVNDECLQQIKDRQLEEHSDHLLTEELFSNNNNVNANINEVKNKPKGTKDNAKIKDNSKIKDNTKIKDNAKIKEIINNNDTKAKCNGNNKTVLYDDDNYYELEQKLLNK